jgi:hypothetical protein
MLIITINQYLILIVYTRYALLLYNKIQKEIVPHYHLSSNDKLRGIHQKFIVGNTLFAVLDMRSFKFYLNETT